MYLLVFLCRLQEGYKQAKGSPVPPPPTLVESLKKQGKPSYLIAFMLHNLHSRGRLF